MQIDACSHSLSPKVAIGWPDESASIIRLDGFLGDAVVENAFRKDPRRRNESEIEG